MNKKLKVLHVLPTLKKDGAEVQLANVLQEIKNTNVDVFTFDIYENGDSIESMLKNNNLYFKNSIFYLKNIIDKNKYDIVHSHLPKADLIVGLLRLFNEKFKHIVSVHAKYGTRKSESKLKYVFSNFFWKKTLNRSSGVISISESIKDWLVEEKDIDNDLIKTIYYGVKIKEREQKVKNKNIIGMAARILPWKGFDKVLETAHYLKNENINFSLKLAGSDDIGYLNNLKKISKELNIDDNVEFFDHFSEIDKFFEQIDLFLFLSESEGFGLVVLEAIENNVAVICSNISPLNEFVSNEFNSLVNRENPEQIAILIKSYFDNNCEILKKAQNIQKEYISKNFSIENSAYRLENFYSNTFNV